MSYLIEKFRENNLWVCRVVISDTEAQFFRFDHDPTYEEILDRRQQFLDVRNNPPVITTVPSNKSPSLIEAEKSFVLFCRSLGLPEPTGTPELDAFCMQLKASGQEILALEVAVRALALINNVVHNGGLWKDINWDI